ncbi:hydrogenase maturation nickel metallochaperone HypA [Streptomyces catenulae]|uniref:Hydrogenase maturation factor HypA n=1 Tax=Streptomyces catenulae TaxID=66875 RepID=A0ABV2YS66_9ACTN|nr:hydrogenase maturation nickel metallochaperone HypA [Streptomyces catenulae]
MHEMSLAVAVVEQVDGALRDEPPGTVETVRLQVGELAGVVPDALHFSFTLACEGTVLEGAALHIDTVPGRARCTPCGAEWATGMPPRLHCPDCRSTAAALVAGRELQIVSVHRADHGTVPAPTPASEEN